MILTIIISLITSIVGGIISGFIVNALCQAKIDKINIENEYRLDVQHFSRYITSILKIIESNKYSEFEQSILNAINMRPLTYRFSDKFLNKEKYECIRKINEIISDVESKIKRREKVDYSFFKQELVNLQIDFLDKFNNNRTENNR
jgi:hypothetical protein